MIDALRTLSQAGVLRHLDSAFAAFVTGLDPDGGAPLAVAAAMLSRIEGQGHVCLPLRALCRADSDLFAWPELTPAITQLWGDLPTDIEGWLSALAASRVVQRAACGHDQGQPLVIDGPDTAPRLYLRRYWRHERAIARAVRLRSQHTTPVDEHAVRAWLDQLFRPTHDAATNASAASTTDWQRIACALAIRGALTVITGGPGTGKTYTAARLLALLLATSPTPERLRIALAAPTGKAAARLRQSIERSLQALPIAQDTGVDLQALTQRIGPARTLHALLGAGPDTRRFRHHAGNPLPVDVVIVDEASMIHLEMMAALLDALAPTARLVLIGDKDQLASVEAGAVLGDLCHGASQLRYNAETLRYLFATTGQRLPEAGDVATAPIDTLSIAQQTVMLRDSRRFDGPIGELARAVNDATDPALPAALMLGDHGGALFIAEGGPVSEAVALAVGGRPGAAACYRIYLEQLRQRPRAGDADAHARWAIDVLRNYDRFRMLCAVREGEWGVTGLNQAIERTLAMAGLIEPLGAWYAGRPVMVTRNDPSLGVFNGDVGIALPSGSSGGLRVYFLDGERLRSVSVSRLAHVETAFAMTVHKSQGSEYEHTALVIGSRSGSVLTRELIYTGITRASQAFSLIAERAGLLAEGVGRITRRAGGLRD